MDIMKNHSVLLYQTE